MAELVLFDLDGTLVDHRSAVLTAISELIRPYTDTALPADRLVRQWWTLERHHMDEYLAGRCSFTEQRRRRLRSFLPLLGEPVSDDAALDAWFAEHYQSAYEAAWRLYPDVLPCLANLHALPAAPRKAVLTNGDRHQQRAKLERFGLIDSFDAVLTSDELNVAKPDPTCFTTACRLLGSLPHDTIYVGDWLEGDAIAASRAGLSGIWIDRGFHPLTGEPTSHADLSDPTVTRIEDLTHLTGVQ
ncbi:HAD family hydrolase [Actinoallomurus sp. CA-150999]|uniref:HAD family hydrolase n=1 Tax=Actinoallomurus sp. CA-150999 TaxID=3239887 RepID=UPI003D8C4225